MDSLLKASIERRPHAAHPRDHFGRPLPEGSEDQLQRVEPADSVRSNREALLRAVELFDAQRFYEAHEYFEYLWKSDETDVFDRWVWKGLTQLSAACCHIQRGNDYGAVVLLRRCIELLKRYPPVYEGMPVDACIELARALILRLSDTPPSPSFPFRSFPSRESV